MDSSKNDPHTLCSKCNNYVRTPNFLIHEARCKGPSSNSQPSAVTSRILNNSRAFSSINKPKAPNQQQRAQQQQRIPCHFCGYPQTLLQLDTHPKTCQHREQKCSSCKNMFPLSLMDQHSVVCPGRRQQHRQQSQQYSQSYQNEFDDRYRNRQQEYNDLPRRPQQNVGQRHDDYNQPNVRQRQNGIDPTDIFSMFMGRMGNMNMMMNNMSMNMNNMMRDQNQNQNQNPGRRVIRVSSFRDFMTLIQALAGRNGHQQIGLTKQQIKNFNVSKYKKKKKNNTKQAQQEQLCIICYCNFQEGEDCMTLPCKHVFHPECVGTWLQKNPTCPVCKHNYGNNERQEQQEYQHFRM